MAKYTIKDIAELAGVSIGTVSRVLNNADNVDDEIRAKTMRVINKCNYKPSARGRSSRRSAAPPEQDAKSIAVVFSGMDSSWQANNLWTSFMSGIEMVCQNQKIRCDLYFAGQEVSTEQLVASGAIGVLVKSTPSTPDYLHELADHFPIVFFGAYNPSLPYMQVSFDDYAAGYAIAQELIALGHQRITFIDSIPNAFFSHNRARGVCDALRQSDLMHDNAVVALGDKEHIHHVYPQPTPPNMTGLLEQLLEMPEPPTALIFANDWNAIGFYQACHAKGISIPDQFSVVGIDDTGEVCQAVSPPLSSMALPFQQVSAYAVGHLLAISAGLFPKQRNSPSVHFIPGEFRPRGSIRKL